MFLRSLPIGSRFQIIGFGSTFEYVFKDGLQEYNEKSLSEASSAISNWNANLGKEKELKLCIFNFLQEEQNLGLL